MFVFMSIYVCYKQVVYFVWMYMCFYVHASVYVCEQLCVFWRRVFESLCVRACMYVGPWREGLKGLF